MSNFTRQLEAWGTKIITAAGVALTRRKTLDFYGDGVEVTDDPTNLRTRVNIPGTGSGVSDHGALTGLADDDHTIYVKKAGDVQTGNHTWSAGNIAVNAGTATSLNLRRGSGSPNGVVSASKGSLYQRTDSAGQHYVNTDGATAWSELAAGTELSDTVPTVVGGAASLGAATKAMRQDAKLDIGVKGSNVASAATINLSTATGDFVHVTGTTGITAITLAQGLVRTVVFDGVLTLTHSSNLILPTSANITTAAGDWMECRGEGSSVTRVMYFRGDGTPLAGNTSFASATETITGSETAKAVTPDSLAALWEAAADNAGTTSITFGEGGTFNLITSSATIGSFVFTVSKAGRIARCRTNTVRTITHNATSLICPTAADIVTQVGDTFEVEDLGSGNVRVRAYQRADGSQLMPDGMKLLRFTFDTSTTVAADPGNGDVRFNSGTYSAVTGICIDDVNALGTDIEEALQCSRSGFLTFYVSDTAWVKYKFKSLTDESGYTLYDVDYIDGEGVFASGQQVSLTIDTVEDLKFRTALLTNTDNGAYGDYFEATWNLSTLWPGLPDNCVVAATVYWVAGVLAGDTDDVVHDLIAWQRILLTYNGGVLIQAQDKMDWLAGAAIQYSVVSAQPFNNGNPTSSGMLSIDTDGGLVTASFQMHPSTLATRARASLRVDETFERNLLTAP